MEPYCKALPKYVWGRKLPNSLLSLYTLFWDLSFPLDISLSVSHSAGPENLSCPKEMGDRRCVNHPAIFPHLRIAVSLRLSASLITWLWYEPCLAPFLKIRRTEKAGLFRFCWKRCMYLSLRAIEWLERVECQTGLRRVSVTLNVKWCGRTRSEPIASDSHLTDLCVKHPIIAKAHAR